MSTFVKRKKSGGADILILACLIFKAIAKLTASSIKKQLPSMHKTHTGLSDAQAEIEYLKVSMPYSSDGKVGKHLAV